MGGKEEDSRGRVREKTGATVPGAVGSEHGLKHVTEVRGPLNFALSPQPCVQDPGKKFSPPPTECDGEMEEVSGRTLGELDPLDCPECCRLTPGREVSGG